MKKLIGGPIGGGASAELAVNAGNFEAKVVYPVASVLAPIKKAFVDKLKALIPGSWDDVLIDKAWAEALKFLAD